MFQPCRIATIDGLRGVLACVVLADHVVRVLGSHMLDEAATASVWAFFVMSGHVLTRAYPNQYLPFLLRRVIRLWPTYAVCLLIGYTLLGEFPDWRVLVWYPPQGDHWFRADVPAWSLQIEAWAMLAMPLIAWFGRGSVLLRGCIALPLLLLPAGYGFYLGCFFLGGVLSRWEPRCALLEAAVPQWLGSVSYSLYLSHMPVLIMTAAVLGIKTGVVLGLPIVFAVAWLVWQLVEHPSILASRSLGSFLTRLPHFGERRVISMR
jgi:peptidoglycan/LPS O-acetylase OafA/YrhL